MAYTTLNTKNKRDQLKTQLDDFATFQWRGHHMFDDFGCFIINEQKGGLKFYNGPSFTNQYAKTQFSSSVNTLLGVDFKQQTIPMKVGLYWFTIEEYQEFLECIGPYQVNYITFDFDDKYGYLVKSGKIADSTKYVIGTDENGKKRYYTELDLTWEVLGDSCVRSNLSYEYDATINNKVCTWTAKTNVDMTNTSLLDTPLVFEIPCCFTNHQATLTLDAFLEEKTTNGYTFPLITKRLFDLKLQNLTYVDGLKSAFSFNQAWAASDPLYQLYLRYDSETGLIYIQNGSQTSWRLLNYQTDNTNGQPLLSSLQSFKYKIPGKFNLSDRETTEWKFRLTYDGIDLGVIDPIQLNQAITMYSRKNVI